MKELFNKKISYNTIIVLALVALLLITIPIAYLGKFDVPSADDYSYSTDTYHALLESSSVLKGALATVKRVFNTWQGTYSAVFMMSLQPSIFSFTSYSATPIINIISLAISIFSLMVSILKYMGCFHREKSGIIAIVLILVCLQFIPSPVQGIYWYNGSIYYTFFFSLALLEISLFFAFLRNGRITLLPVLVLLSFLIGGSNFSTALMCSVVNFGILGIGFIRNNNNWKALVVPSIVCVIGLVISCLAPGNSIRQSEYISHPSAVQAIVSSITSLPHLLISWPSLVIIGMLIFLFPFFLDASKEMNLIIRYPFLYTIASYLLLAVMICPTQYVFGSYGPPRLVNTVFFAYVILLGVNELIWIRYFVQKLGASEVVLFTNTANLLFASIVFILCIGLSVFINHSSLTSITAISEIRNGEAEVYYSEALERQAIFESSKGKDVEISPYSVQPYLLFFDDFSSDSNDWKNVDACTYFGINTITCK